MPTGKFIMKNASVVVNGVDLSDHCSSITVEDTADQIEVTTFGPSAYKSYLQGFKDATITATFYADFAASSVHATLLPLYTGGGTFDVVVKADAATTSATNPTATMTSTLYAYSGIVGQVGAASSHDAVFRNSGTAGLVYGTS